MRLKHTDWRVLNTQATLDSHMNTDSYASSVLDFINTNINSVTTLITPFPNQMLWMKREVLQKARNTALRSGDAQVYSSSMANLKRGIKRVKHSHKLRIEKHFNNNSDPRRMWQGIKSVTDYKPTQPAMPPSLMSLTVFYACFDRNNQEADHQLLRSPPPMFVLSRINAREAAGPGGFPGRVLRD